MKTVLLILSIFLWLNVSYGQSVTISWQTDSETSLLQIKNDAGEVKEYNVKSKSFDVPISKPGNYYWRIKANDEDKMSDFSDWGLIEASDSILNVSKALMISPKNNSIASFQTDVVDLNLSFERPKKKWSYFLQIYQDETKIVDTKIDEDFYKLRVPKTAKLIRWKVTGKSKYGNVTRETSFWSIKLQHQTPLKRFKLAVSSSKDGKKGILSWDDQPGCMNYTVYEDDKRLGIVKKNKTSIPLSLDKKIIKVECTGNKYNYGMIGMKLNPSRVATKIKFNFIYQFTLSQFAITQETQVSAETFKNNFTLQSHSLGHDFRWGDQDRNKIIPFLRYGRTLTFSDEITVTTMGGLIKYHPFKSPDHRLLGEMTQTKIEYTIDDDTSLSQTINFIGLGYETTLTGVSPKFNVGGLVKRTISSGTPSFEIRSYYEATPRLKYHLDIQQSTTNFKFENEGVQKNAETKIMLVEAGISYNF